MGAKPSDADKIDKSNKQSYLPDDGHGLLKSEVDYGVS
jgi:hypothetical protein